jgi:hypothetical protein
MKHTTKGTARKAPARKPAKDYAHSAEFTLDIINADDTPQIIKDAIHDALVEAQNQTQIEILIPGGYDPAQLAVLLRSADKHGLRIHSGFVSSNDSRRRDHTGTDAPRPLSNDELAALIAAVFAHPDLPERMWGFIADGLCELDNGFEKYENPEVMRAVLAGYKPRRQSMRKGGK